MMSEKRRRYRNKNKHQDDRQKQTEPDVQPKILLKPRAEKSGSNDGGAASAEIAQQIPQKTIIVTRSETLPSPSFSRTSPNMTKELNEHVQPILLPKIIEPVPQMTRPATIISSTGLVNTSVKKTLMSTNTDFLVVGVIGMQGVGKSTIMNLLANEKSDYDYYQKIFIEEDCVFPTKLRLNKCSARSRTESTHMFITSDRMILIDSPPVLCNSYKKDMISNEVDDFCQIISFLTVCHLVIVIQDDYFNLNFIRLLQLAEQMKPKQENPPFLSDYFPNLMFVKNKAKRNDFSSNQKNRLDNILKTLFKNSKMRIYLGQTSEQRQKKVRTSEIERTMNTFLIPDMKGGDAPIFHKPLNEIIAEFRSLVFMTPRNEMHTGPTELTEELWFDMLCQATQDKQHFAINTYHEVHRKHYDYCNGNGNGGASGSNNSNNQGKNEIES